jgi:hypothetical protein
MSIIGGLLAVGLLAGCGGTEAGMEEQSNLDSRKDELPGCGNREYLIDFYSDPGLTNHVGARWCNCGDTTASHYGGSSAYYEYAYDNAC